MAALPSKAAQPRSRWQFQGPGDPRVHPGATPSRQSPSNPDGSFPEPDFSSVHATCPRRGWCVARWCPPGSHKALATAWCPFGGTASLRLGLPSGRQGHSLPCRRLRSAVSLGKEGGRPRRGQGEVGRARPPRSWGERSRPRFGDRHSGNEQDVHRKGPLTLTTGGLTTCEPPTPSSEGSTCAPGPTRAAQGRARPGGAVQAAGTQAAAPHPSPSQDAPACSGGVGNHVNEG